MKKANNEKTIHQQLSAYCWRARGLDTAFVYSGKQHRSLKTTIHTEAQNNKTNVNKESNESIAVTAECYMTLTVSHNNIDRSLRVVPSCLNAPRNASGVLSLTEIHHSGDEQEYLS